MLQTLFAGLPETLLGRETEDTAVQIRHLDVRFD